MVRLLYFACPSALLLADGAVAGPEGSLLGQGVIAVLVGLIGWMVKYQMTENTKALQGTISEQTAEMKKLRSALDTNTHVQTVALLEIAALIPGAKPMLEQKKKEIEERTPEAKP